MKIDLLQNYLQMKKIVLIALFTIAYNVLSAQNATDIVRKADEKMDGEKSSISTMTMTIVRPTWTRTVKFKNWVKGRQYALTLIEEPIKDKGRTFLKLKNEMWSWSPSISQLRKLPPSMMSQGWMGSDFTNDDVLKESSLVVDYTHKLLGSETIENLDCYKIELIPKPEAAISWGKLILWISKLSYLQLKAEYYDEDGLLAKTEIASKIKKMDDREIPTHMEIIPEENKGQKTLVEINSMKFNAPIEDSFFSIQNMKNVK